MRSGTAPNQATTAPRRWLRRHVEDPLRTIVGGAARLRVIVLLAGVLALSTADLGVISAVAVQLKASLGINNTDIGLLVSVSTAVGAIATLPMGMIADRANRVRLLHLSILVWCGAIVLCGAAASYPMLLASRILLGLLVAAAGPLVASLVGDLFPASARGRIYGYILCGEILGVAVGLLLCGNIAAALSWRFAFWVLLPPGLILAWAIRRLLPEPARGGDSDQRHDPTSDPQPEDSPASGRAATDGAHHDATSRPAVKAAPHRRQVLRTDPSARNLWWAVRYILTVRTNLALIIASALGYFYFTGLQTFAIIYLHGRYGLPETASTALLVLIGLGAIVGLLLSGRIADALDERRYVGARPVVAGTAFLLCAVLLSAGLLVNSLAAAVPLMFLAAAALGGANPPLDAARLDIMHPRLWGRAESVRTVFRSGLVALAPVLFGVVSGSLNPVDDTTGVRGLRDTLLIMLTTLVISGLVLIFVARRTYPRDVATVLASGATRR